MKAYRITIRADRFPTDYVVQASSWSTAIARAIREWQKRFKGCRTTQLDLRAIKNGHLLLADDKE